FAHHFVCTPICSASRATLFTGRTPMQHGIHDFLTPKPVESPPQGQAAPPASFRNEVFLSDMLAANGYTCGYYGKWHLGFEEQAQHGFTRWYVIPGGSSPYQDPVMISSTGGGEVRRVPEKGYLADLIHEHAVEFIEEARKKPNPWFAVVSHFNPHTPLNGHPQKYYDLYRDVEFKTFPLEPAKPNALRERNLLADPIGNLRKTAASTTALDDRVGALLDYLDEKKLSEQTLLVFVGDNGFLLGRHGYWSKGLASDPINMYEEVMAVPLIARWLQTIPSGRARQELVSFYDFLPSVLDLLGLPLPKSRNLCGRSYWPLLTTRALGRWDNRVYGYFRNTVMLREEQHKLLLRNQQGNQWRGPNELYDLAADPTEHANRFDDRALGRVRERMTRDLNAWIKKYSA
ncbi:MAG: sulfatase-like hydrolase/transferase, partial [Acidobacteria bacterium]|nr:sulfatase-like hydrolase/transferase [Acidobacteriota bacterium]